MVKTNHLGALAATAGALVAVGLLMLMMLVVEVRPAEATFPGKPKVGGGSRFNVTDNTTNDYTPSYSPNGKEIAYRGTGSNGRHNEIYTIKVSGGGRLQVTNDHKERARSILLAQRQEDSLCGLGRTRLGDLHHQRRRGREAPSYQQHYARHGSCLLAQRQEDSL
jgi:hypothetical protein